jgi:hypothetical protein
MATCVFCSAPDPMLGLLEGHRLFAQGGQLLLLEHADEGESTVEWHHELDALRLTSCCAWPTE